VSIALTKAAANLRDGAEAATTLLRELASALVALEPAHAAVDAAFGAVFRIVEERGAAARAAAESAFVEHSARAREAPDHGALDAAAADACAALDAVAVADRRQRDEAFAWAGVAPARIASLLRCQRGALAAALGVALAPADADALQGAPIDGESLENDGEVSPRSSSGESAAAADS
jgi:hypothetical protein